MTKRKTPLPMKCQDKGAVPNNYRPVTCLSTTFKLMTAEIVEAIQDHLQSDVLMPQEQKSN